MITNVAISNVRKVHVSNFLHNVTESKIVPTDQTRAIARVSDFIRAIWSVLLIRWNLTDGGGVRAAGTINLVLIMPSQSYIALSTIILPKPSELIRQCSLDAFAFYLFANTLLVQGAFDNIEVVCLRTYV